MIAVLDRAHRVSILRVLNLDAPVYIRQVDVRATCANLSPQVVPDKSMMIDVQAEIIADAT